MTANLPARAEFTTGTASIPLSAAPTAALAFALGYAAARPVSANHFGPFCALVEELSVRSTDAELNPGDLGRWDPRTELGQLLATLPPDMARQITLLYQAQRGQRWAATGHRDGRAQQ
ncbi:hypothetical protein CG91_gp059 [Mycobacterium phage 39HC]|uniref:hypothetical protein n=1 Tax=Mycobacterium phage 39HC TaxID=1463809 RepID=UPI0003F1F38C|nr:hypothetical protein CG91_gp059 [Mycobacterium phage 39HC]AHJ88359.1 hypothetical protein 39HC_059 [Mycobacterium phage 39HC]AHJ88459.1 hypothetical protein 40BC_059 [Mycobacterium phage 40BC]